MEINEIEDRKTVKKIAETKSWLSGKINTIDNPSQTDKEKERRHKLSTSRMR